MKIEIPQSPDLLMSPYAIMNEELKSDISKLSIQERRIERTLPLESTGIFVNLTKNGIGSSDGPSNNLKRKSSTKMNTFIEIKKLNKRTEKLLNHNLIEFASHYVNNFIKTTNKDWQITRNFVTSMIEVY